jgi:hypothetical protein
MASFAERSLYRDQVSHRYPFLSRSRRASHASERRHCTLRATSFAREFGRGDYRADIQPFKVVFSRADIGNKTSLIDFCLR